MGQPVSKLKKSAFTAPITRCPSRSFAADCTVVRVNPFGRYDSSWMRGFFKSTSRTSSVNGPGRRHSVCTTPGATIRVEVVSANEYGELKKNSADSEISLPESDFIAGSL